MIKIDKYPCYLFAYLLVTSLAWIFKVHCNLYTWSIAVIIAILLGEIIFNWVKNLDEW